MERLDERTELNLIVEPEVRPYRGPILLDHSGPLANEENIAGNGGFTLVDTGAKKLLVTCFHVSQEFKTMKDEEPNARILACLDLNNPVILNELTPIDEDARLDIVTIDFSQMLSACAGRQFFRLSESPPKHVRKGDKLVLVGNQGQYRFASNEHCLLGATVYGIVVTNVDGPRFQADIANSNVLEKMKPRTGRPHAGISGSPCFLYRTGRRCEMVGITTTYWGEMLWFTHIGCINTDGTIKKLN
jgi:hypothetical protein